MLLPGTAGGLDKATSKEQDALGLDPLGFLKDASIAANAVDEPLVDRPYEVKGIGPFTFDSLSPHRVLPANEDDPLFLAQLEEPKEGTHLAVRASEEAATESDDFIRFVLDNLKAAGVGNTKKGERLRFTALRPFPGRYVNAEGRYIEGDSDGAPERKAAIFIGPEYGTGSTPKRADAWLKSRFVAGTATSRFRGNHLARGAGWRGRQPYLLMHGVF